MSASCCHDCHEDDPQRGNPAYRRTLWIVLAINAVMFAVEIGAGVMALPLVLAALLPLMVLPGGEHNGFAVAVNIAAWLVFTFPEQPWVLALYIAGISVFSLVCVHFLAETSRKDLTADSQDLAL